MGAPGDGADLARRLIAAGLVEDISAATSRRRLAAHPLKPWRHPRWRDAKHPRDAACDGTGSDLSELYPRPLRDDERGLARDEQTSLQPPPRLTPTRPAPPQTRPNRYAHESTRAGALHLCAAVATRAGRL
jgi:hypothetical protein